MLHVAMVPEEEIKSTLIVTDVDETAVTTPSIH
jgi:hypothetical protein